MNCRTQKCTYNPGLYYSPIATHTGYYSYIQWCLPTCVDFDGRRLGRLPGADGSGGGTGGSGRLDLHRVQQGPVPRLCGRRCSGEMLKIFRETTFESWSETVLYMSSVLGVVKTWKNLENFWADLHFLSTIAKMLALLAFSANNIMLLV